jgi:hypothetical protein
MMIDREARRNHSLGCTSDMTSRDFRCAEPVALLVSSRRSTAGAPIFHERWRVHVAA